MNPSVPNTQVLRQVLSVLHLTARGWFSDAYAKKLYVGNTCLLFLEAILRQRPSVENIVDHLQQTPWLKQWTGLDKIHPSNVYRKLPEVPTALLCETYKEVIGMMLGSLGPPPSIGRLGPLAPIDASHLTLGKVRGEWAYLQPGVNAVKIHTCLLLMGEDSALPAATVLSTAGVADLDAEVLGQLVQRNDVTYLLDRGYIDYHRLVQWHLQGILFAMRVKANSKLKVLRRRSVPKGLIVSDEDVELRDPDTGEVAELRLVTYTVVDKKGKTHKIRVLTNRFDLRAKDVALAYRYRWKVELFFRCIKHSFHLKKLYNTKETAVWNQIYLHLIAYALCEWCRRQVAPDIKIGRFVKKLRVTLEKPWEALVEALHPIKRYSSQGRRKRPGRKRIHPRYDKPQRILYY